MLWILLCCLVLLSRVLSQPVAPAEPSWDVQYMWIVHDQATTSLNDASRDEESKNSRSHSVAVALYPMSPIEKRDQLWALCHAVLGDGSEDDRLKLSEWLVQDIQELTDILTEQGVVELLSLRPGVLFNGPIQWRSGISRQEAFERETKFISISFKPKDFLRLPTVGFKPMAKAISFLDEIILRLVESFVGDRPTVSTLHTLYVAPVNEAVEAYHHGPHYADSIAQLRFRAANYMAMAWNLVLEPRLVEPPQLRLFNLCYGLLLGLKRTLEEMDPPMDILSFHEQGRYVIPFAWDERAAELWTLMAEEDERLGTPNPWRQQHLPRPFTVPQNPHQRHETRH